jgi:hypothetical protein
MSPTVKAFLERVASWPEEDQEELAEVAREIEARRKGVYRLSEAERQGIEKRPPGNARRQVFQRRARGGNSQ